MNPPLHPQMGIPLTFEAKQVKQDLQNQRPEIKREVFLTISYTFLVPSNFRRSKVEEMKIKPALHLKLNLLLQLMPLRPMELLGWFLHIYHLFLPLPTITLSLKCTLKPVTRE